MANRDWSSILKTNLIVSRWGEADLDWVSPKRKIGKLPDEDLQSSIKYIKAPSTEGYWLLEGQWVRDTFLTTYLLEEMQPSEPKIEANNDKEFLIKNWLSGSLATNEVVEEVSSRITPIFELFYRASKEVSEE